MDDSETSLTGHRYGGPGFSNRIHCAEINGSFKSNPGANVVVTDTSVGNTVEWAGTSNTSSKVSAIVTSSVSMEAPSF